ncbi:hypothetical protein D3C76_1696370 [compost metagenome]
MGKHSVADVDAHMRNAFTAGVKEHQIPGAKVGFGNPVAFFILGNGAAGQFKIELGEQVLGEA